MNKIFSAILIALLCSLGSLQLAWAEVVIEEGFEGELTGWTTGKDLPEDPNNPGNPVAAEAVPSTDRAYRGAQSLKLYIDGRQDDGTLWIARQVPVSTSDSTEVVLEFRFWSPFEGSFNNLAYVVGYIGEKMPAEEADFTRIAPVTEVGEWELISLRATLPPSATGQTWVAAGFSVVWETEQTYYLDELRVETVTDPPTPVQDLTWGQLKEWFAVR
jgi:hypothetical protein